MTLLTNCYLSRTYLFVCTCQWYFFSVFIVQHGCGVVYWLYVLYRWGVCMYEQLQRRSRACVGGDLVMGHEHRLCNGVMCAV